MTDGPGQPAAHGYEDSDYVQHDQSFTPDRRPVEGRPEIRGYDFNRGFDFFALIESFATTGIQATKLARAIAITRSMVRARATIFLTCTSNMGSSGVRDIIRYLVQHRHVHALCMSAGAVEEDVIKTLRPFLLGDFSDSGSGMLREGCGRIGNILAPYDRYLELERLMRPFLERVHEAATARGRPFTVSEFIAALGHHTGHDESILTWAARHDIPVFCPAITDGAIGDLVSFMKRRHPDFCLDVVGDSQRISEFVLAQERTGALVLGGGAAKHFVLNASIFRGGLDYAVYISTAAEYDASDSGGNIEEAISWAKIRPDGECVKVACEASIAFPLLVAAVFAAPQP
jgi:deoxyhypusine synthase